MKKIAFLSDSMERKGGSQRVATNLANEFVGLYDVHFITWFENKYQYEINTNIKKHHLCNDNKRIRNCVKTLNVNLCKLINNEGIDILFIVGRYAALASIFAFVSSKCRIVCCEHSSLCGYNMLYSTLKTKLISNLILTMYVLFAYKVVFLTQKDADAFSRKFYCKDKVLNIYNWIEEDLSKVDNKYDIDSKQIISVGRIAPEKNYELLIKSANRVLNHYKDWKWDIYGDGDPIYKSKLEKMVKDYGLSDRLVFKGNVDDLNAKYPLYSFLVMTSKFEGLPMTMLEAKENKLPLVSFDIDTGPSDIIRNGIDGFLIAPFDLNVMCNRIEELIACRELRTKFSNNSHGNISKFSKNEILKKWISLIESVTP